ncbi:uncharacterized protein LOC111260177 [Varroa jacobsoni]|uniref:uncharacterized protein LOC111260177 n=1 Tax=Varroa jacobsoni TaxID=62625 RepID=UPI000BF2F363|nr:uncharacterized protein LOC111260177 [Varroa jacobsoni]
MNYDYIYPRSSTPNGLRSNSLPLGEVRDSLIYGFEVPAPVRREKSVRSPKSSRAPSPPLSSTSSEKPSPKTSLKSILDSDEPRAIERISLQGDTRTKTVSNESLVPFQETHPEKERVVLRQTSTPSTKANDWTTSFIEPSPSEPFIPRLITEPSLENLTEYRRIEVASPELTGSPSFFFSLLNAHNESASPLAKYLKDSSCSLTLTHERSSEKQDKRPRHHELQDSTLGNVSTHERQPLPTPISRSKTLRDISTILQVAGDVYKSDQSLSKDSILQLGALYKEADAVLRSTTTVEAASALLHDAEEQHRSNQRLIKDVLQEQQTSRVRITNDTPRSETFEKESSVLKETAEDSLTVTHQRPGESVIGLQGRPDQNAAIKNIVKPKTQLDIPAILRAADVIGDLCASDIVSPAQAVLLESKHADVASMSIEQGDIGDFKDGFGRSGKKPTALSEDRSTKIAGEAFTSRSVSCQQRRKKCKHKGDHSSSTRESSQETSLQNDANPLSVIERLRRRVLKSTFAERQKSATDVVAIDPSVEILSFPSRSSAAHYHRDSLRQESSVVLVDFVSPQSQRPLYYIPVSQRRGSLTASLSDHAVQSVESNDSHKQIQEVAASSVCDRDDNQGVELTKIV